MVTQEELEKMSPEQIAELQKQNCIFCKIIAGEIPAAKVFENDKVIALLDINPAKNGHTLVMPKEHHPILPLVPPDVFSDMFIQTKIIAKAIKEATLANTATVFIANGALAGQQSPHFLFHIIPDHKVPLKPNPQMKERNEGMKQSLSHNLTIMMQNHAQRQGLDFGQPAQAQQPAASKEEMAAMIEKKREQIAKIIEENEDVRNLLMTDVEGFKKEIEKDQTLVQLFQGVDLNVLSQQLNKLQEEHTQEQAPNEEPKPEPPSPQPQEVPPKIEEEPTPQSVAQYSDTTPSPKPKPEVFLGADPYAQKQKVFEYLDARIQAKELLMKDPQTFRELLEKRPDIQPIFQDVNIEKLSQKLNEAYGGEKSE